MRTPLVELTNKEAALLLNAKVAHRIEKSRQPLQQCMAKIEIQSPADAVAAARSVLQDKHKENFIGLYLNSRNRIRKTELISLGTVNAALVHPRETFRPALMSRAVALIVLHNHPSGEVEPSEEDKEMTRKLYQAGEVLGIKLLDHIIFDASQTYYSFKQQGYMDALEGC